MFNAPDAVKVRRTHAGTCALTGDGKVLCWGQDKTANKAIGVTSVTGMPAVSDIDSNESMTCAVAVDGRLFCWPLGTFVAKQVATGLRSVAVGPAHLCGVTGDAKLACWVREPLTLGEKAAGTLNKGSRYGQLGNGGQQEAIDSAPAIVKEVVGAQQACVGANHTCALDGKGQVWCFGYFGAGNMGVPYTVWSQYGWDDQKFAGKPIPVPLTDVSELACSSGTSCALKTDGTVHCWGSGNERTVGSATNQLTPNKIPGLPSIIGISAGGSDGGATVCARAKDGSSWCWGSNMDGQIASWEPGKSGDPLIPTPVAGAQGYVDIVAGGGGMCGLKTDKSLWCWGKNDAGQFGNGGKTGSAVPVKVPVAQSFAHLALGDDHMCARTDAGAVFCWGSGGTGQYGNLLGNGSNDASLTPLAVQDLGVVADLSVSYNHTCVAQKDGTAKCWGYDANGELGAGKTWTDHKAQPVTFKGLEHPVSAVGAQGSTTCVLTAKDATIRCVGGSDVYGRPTGYGFHVDPVKVAGP